MRVLRASERGQDQKCEHEPAHRSPAYCMPQSARSQSRELSHTIPQWVSNNFKKYLDVQSRMRYNTGGPQNFKSCIRPVGAIDSERVSSMSAAYAALSEVTAR